MLLINCNSFAFANTENINYTYIETDNGFVLTYDIIENGSKVHYVEKVDGDVVNTKKYTLNGNEMILFEELNTIINEKSNGEITGTIINLSKNTSTTEVIKQPTLHKQSENNMLEFSRMSRKKWHPDYDDYYLGKTISSSLNFKKFTKAAVIAVVTTLITKGNVGAGIIAGVVALVLDSGISNLYYEEETYYPYGSGAGRPIWKKITTLYYDRNLTNQFGNSLYIDADLLTKI
jgi:hypothetical protein